MAGPRQENQVSGRAAQTPLDASEFAELFRGSMRKLWLIAAGMLHDRHLAEDAVQEAAMLGLSKRGQFERDTNFAAWMSQIVRHVARNTRRREARRRMAPLDELEPTTGRSGEGGPGANPGLGPRGEMPDDQPHFDDRLRAALADLSDTARACLLLRTIEQLDYAEISRLLEIPPGTAMSHVHRARRQLRRALGGGTTTPDSPDSETRTR